MAASDITIRPAVAADADAIAQAHYEALDQFHAFYAAFLRRHPRDMLPDMTKTALAKGKETFLVAQEKEDVVGFVRYSVEEGKTAEDKEREKKNAEAEKARRKKEAEEKGEEVKEEVSPYACKEEMEPLWREFEKKLEPRDELLERIALGKKHIWIQHLMIRPSHQRRGIGGMLLARVLEEADRAGLPQHIVSSAESVGLYKKMGFASLGRFVTDNGHWAREVARRKPGAEGEMLAERYDGVYELEDVMVRGLNGKTE